MHTCIHTHKYMHVSRLCYAQLYLHTWAPAHARAHTSAHTNTPAPHRRSRRAQRPAPHRRPAERVPPAVARCPWPERAAHTPDKSVTAAVFHAPMSALNADANANACGPNQPRSTADGTRSHGSARMRARPIARARAHARTDAARGRVRAAGPHRRSVLLVS